MVIDPQGKIAAGPLRQQTGILAADIDLSSVAVAKRSLDVAGHYARSDVFELRVNTGPRKPLTLE